MNSPFLFFILLSGFITLAHVSYPHENSYDTEAMDKLVEASKPLTPAQRQAMTIADLYGVTDEWKPINLFGE